MEQDEKKMQQVTMNYPTMILKEIDNYAKKNGITTRTSAILELIRKGLQNQT